MCDSSQEPYGFIDHREEKTKKYTHNSYLTELFAKNWFKKTMTIFIEKKVFCYSFSQISIFFKHKKLALKRYCSAYW